jgi:hypothetical protein
MNKAPKDFNDQIDNPACVVSPHGRGGADAESPSARVTPRPAGRSRKAARRELSHSYTSLEDEVARIEARRERREQAIEESLAEKSKKPTRLEPVFERRRNTLKEDLQNAIFEVGPQTTSQAPRVLRSAPGAGGAGYDGFTQESAEATLLGMSLPVQRVAPLEPFDLNYPRAVVRDIPAEVMQIRRLFAACAACKAVLDHPDSCTGLLADPWNRKVWADCMNAVYRLAMGKLAHLVRQLEESDTLRARLARQRAAIRAAHRDAPGLSKRELGRSFGVSDWLVRKALREE